MEDLLKKYGDIINMSHHQSGKRQRMPISDRAAQFSPFAALTGHADAIKETARLTDEYVEPSDDMKAAINEKIVFLITKLSTNPIISVTYFSADEKKSGGAYVTITGAVKKIRQTEKIIEMISGEKIFIDDIVDIDGAVFI